MKDVDGNGPDYPVKDTLRDLARSLRNEGFASWRFAWDSDSPLQLAQMIYQYRQCMEQSEIDHDNIVLLGFGDGADLVAGHFYDFYEVEPAQSILLLSPTVGPLQLNAITCPYFLIHGDRDPLFNEITYEKFHNAILHHQMRYGDVTNGHCFEGVGRELGDNRLSRDVIRCIVDWTRYSLRHRVRPQEPAAKGAA